MSKIPLADGSQSDTLYSVLPFGVNVRSSSEAACSVTRSNGNVRRDLKLMLLANYIFALQATAIRALSAY